MKKKLKRFYKKLVSILFEFIYGKIDKVESGEKYKQMVRIKGFKKNYYIYNLKKGRLFTDTVHDTAFINFNRIVSGPSFQIRNLINSSAKNNTVFSNNTPKIKKKINGLTLSILTGGAGNNNYWHWMYDVLPRIAIVKIKYNIGKIDNFIVPDIKYDFQIQTLKLLNIYDKSLPSIKFRHLETDRLIGTTHPWQFTKSAHQDINNIPKWITLWIRDTFLKKKKFYDHKYEKIYINRSDSSSNLFNKRNIKNEFEIQSYLKKIGFKILNLSEFKIEKQIRIFNSAKIIIGNHGAGFTNIVYCKKNTTIIEFITGYTSKPFKKISSDLGLKYFSIKGDQVGFNSKDQYNDIVLPLKKLKKLLK